MSVVETSQLGLNEESLNELHDWIGTLSLSRPKKNLARDFSDGVLVAEALAHFMPKIVDLKNYFPASSAQKKKVNWNTLNWKVLQKMGIRLCDGVIQQLVDCKPGAVEKLLWDIRRTIGGQAPASRAQTPVPEPMPSPAAKSRKSRPGMGYRVQRQERTEKVALPPVAGEDSSATMICVSEKEKSAPNSLWIKEPEPADMIGSFKSDEDKNGNIVTKLDHGPTYLDEDECPITKPGGTSVVAAQMWDAYEELDKKERDIAGLQQANVSLLTKIRRAGILVGEKDQEIEELVLKLHELRSLYDCVAVSAAAGTGTTSE